MKRVIVVLCVALVAVVVSRHAGHPSSPCAPQARGPSLGGSCALHSYATSFNTTEDPLSESGAWNHRGLDWTRVVSNGSIAHGTHRDTGYDDSYAYLSGFRPDQSIRGTVFKSGRFARYQEIELHLRWADSDHVARGYEVLIEANNHYSNVVRWNGRLGDFTILLKNLRIPRAPVTGDVLEARIVGSTITVLFNGTIVGQVTDSTWTTGNPGIGFFSRDATGSANSRFGWSDITATDL